MKNAPASPASFAKSSNPRIRAISSRRRLAGLATLPATLSISDTRSPVSSSSSSIAFRNSRLAFFCAVHSCKHGSLQYGADFLCTYPAATIRCSRQRACIRRRRLSHHCGDCRRATAFSASSASSSSLQYSVQHGTGVLR